MKIRSCAGVLTNGTRCPYSARIDSIVPLCDRHLKAVGAWYNNQACGSLEEGHGADRICEYPGSFCTVAASKMHPELRMCDAHLFAIADKVRARNDAEREAMQRQHEEWVAQRELREAHRTAARRAVTAGTIYYLRINGGYKIGWTSNLYDRLKQYPPTAELLATEPGTRAEEQTLHRRFAPYRVAGREWYRRASKIGKHIKQVAEIHGAEDPRDPIVTLPKTPQERTVERMRWDGKGTRRIS